jgi:protein disulfide-isomerase A6
MIVVFLALTRGEHLELSDENATDVIGGPAPVFVKFFSPNCGHCSHMAEAWQIAANMFRGVIFASIDCTAGYDTCRSYRVSAYPTLQLFKSNSSNPIAFRGPRTPDEFCDFVENYTEFKAMRPPKRVVNVNPANFMDYRRRTDCLLLTFYATWCAFAKRFLPEADNIADSFAPEGLSKIVVGIVNCDKFAKFCQDNDVLGFPTLILYKRNETLRFNGSRHPFEVVDFVNQHCETHRGYGGLLKRDVGVHRWMSSVVGEFVKSNDQHKEELLENLRKSGDSELYWRLLMRLKEKGAEQLRTDLDKTVLLLDERLGSWEAMDRVKRVFNILGEIVNFLPRPTPGAGMYA